MTKFGFALSSEEHEPGALVRYAQTAEKIGLDFVSISDHYHPWISKQGHAPFVWSVIGAIAQATDEIGVGTGVTCPTVRIHPSIIAQATATVAKMLGDRFVFGVGTGENLNEHIQGERWYPHDIRDAMLREAVEIIRELWSGETITYYGDFYIVEDARLFTLPDEPPLICVAGEGDRSIETAAEIGDGYWSVSPKQEHIEMFEENGGSGPRYGQATICYAKSEQEAKQLVHELWPNGGLTGELTQELRTVAHFEQAVKLVDVEEATKNIACGNDPQAVIDSLSEFVDAGFDHVYVHNIGHEQDAFFDFFKADVLPELRRKYGND